MKEEHRELARLYRGCFGTEPALEALPASGGSRRYFRMSAEGKPTVIGTVGTDRAENEDFLALQGAMHADGVMVPKVFAVSKDRMCYLQEDLGGVSLFSLIGTPGFEEVMTITVRDLARLQTGLRTFGTAELIRPPFNRRLVMWDLNYFKYCFLRPMEAIFDEARLEDDFERMATDMTGCDQRLWGFMYRDCQSRNVMVRRGLPYWIDFQGGRKGPVYYDVASFLWQAKANYPDSLRQELLKEYIDALRKYQPVDEAYFYAQLRHFVLFRTMQVLGAYGFRGYFEKKPHFIQSVPFAIENLRQLLQEPYPEYPYLCRILRELTELKQFTDDLQKRRLVVKVTSFAYKKGIPEDSTGNGGGFVFDCRAVNNPGKYERYKPFTGLDEPVIRFLEDDGEIAVFLEHAYALVDASVKRYMERGFTNLSVCFGCTGGQHRSVYSAQHLAEHLHKKFGVQVNLIHREQNIEQTFKAKV